MSDHAVAFSAPLGANIRPAGLSASTEATTDVPVPWGYRWRLYILFISQLPAAILGDLCGLSDGPWYHPHFHPVRMWTALAVASLGLALRVWAAAHLSVKTMASKKAEGDDFVCSGPYRICRNPLYVGSLLQCFAYGLQFGWMFAALFAGAHFWRYGSIVRYEEQELRRSAPEPFALYCAKVSQWWPNLFDRAVWQGPFFSWAAIAGNSLFVGLWMGLLVNVCAGTTFWFGIVEVASVIPMIWYHYPRKGIVAENTSH